MTRSLALLLAASFLSACAGVSSTAPVASTTPAVTPELVREFAPMGTLRAGTNFGNPVIVQRDPAGGAPRGVGPSLARELAKRLGVPITYVAYDAAGKMADAAREGAWDVAFLAGDPARAHDMAFSAPYVQIEGAYMVWKDSPIKSNADVDREGIRVAVGAKSAYDLFLTREIKRATLVRAQTSPAAVDLFLAQKLEVAAGVKNPLLEIAAKDPGVRVLDGNFMVIGQAAAVPRARTASAKFLHAFIEEMKANGFVARALQESGVTDATVAPAAR